MKGQFRYIIFTLLALAGSVSAFAYDFAAKNKDGVVIYYKITDKKRHLVKVVAKSLNVVPVTVTKSSKDAVGYYVGDIDIPSQVQNPKDKTNTVYSVTAIGNYAFHRCSNMTSVTIPNSVTTIGYNAFSFCDLTSVTIPNSVITIDEFAFGCCPYMISITIPNSVTDIGKNAFDSCINLKNIILADGLTEQKAKELYAWNNSAKFLKEGEMPAFAPDDSPISTISDMASVDNGNKKIEGGTKQADVDINIPQNAVLNQNTFAVVIANENYRKETTVKFAVNDGRMVQQYLTRTLGLPGSNVHIVCDATLNEMLDEIDWLQQVARAYNGEASVILYYAGHGMPDEQTGTAYLIPADGNSAKPSTCIALNKLYEELAGMNVKRACVFLDACFSGAQRGEGMLMAARGVAIKPKNDVLKGNLVVFSAAQGTETAYPYTEMGHGLFTYYLLKKWQETKGDVSLGALGEYITNEVSRRSIVVNSKSQTPSTAVSTSLGDAWKTWKLK